MGIVERKAREKKQRRQMIIDAAEKVFFSRGLHATTMVDIAQTAELSKGTLYLYFKSKEDLYLAVAGRGLDIMIAMFKKAVRSRKRGIDKVRAVGQAYRDFSRRHTPYFQTLLLFDFSAIETDRESCSARDCQIKADEALSITAEAVRTGIEDGTIRSDLDPIKTAVILWALSSGILQIIATKGRHISEQHDAYTFRDADHIIDYAFGLIRSAIEPRKKES